MKVNMIKKKTPLEQIAAERRRQRRVEGWTLANDDKHTHGELANAAAVYAATEPTIYRLDGDSMWPWNYKWLKKYKHDRKRQLVIAGALIVAELERLEREES